jgi:hypothetical protein
MDFQTCKCPAQWEILRNRNNVDPFELRETVRTKGSRQQLTGRSHLTIPRVPRCCPRCVPCRFRRPGSRGPCASMYVARRHAPDGTGCTGTRGNTAGAHSGRNSPGPCEIMRWIPMIVCSTPAFMARWFVNTYIGFSRQLFRTVFRLLHGADRPLDRFPVSPSSCSRAPLR